MSKTLDPDARVVLRALFELADASVCPTLDLMQRLFDIEPSAAFAHVTQLRRLGLVQEDRLGLTMLGLSVAPGLPRVELSPMRARAEASHAA